MADIVLETKDLSKHFGALCVSDNICLDLKAGEIHAVIGPNGAGKSTLIAQICGTLRPDSGSVHLDGHNITQQAAPARVRAGLARTFQVSALAMEDTVLQNVMLGALGQQRKPWQFFKAALRDAELRSHAEAALERAGLIDHQKALTAEISHGQRRQLEVAIALTLNPKAFIMDEPMAGLGSEGSLQLTKLLGKLRSEAPILLVEHDMDAVFALADRISVLVYGRIIATGTVEEIRASKEVQAAYLGDGA